MKKIIVIGLVSVMAMSLMACKNDGNLHNKMITKDDSYLSTKADNDEEIHLIDNVEYWEGVKVEKIEVEDIEVEDIKIETIDDEYQNELEYNSRSNVYFGR